MTTRRLHAIAVALVADDRTQAVPKRLTPTIIRALDTLSDALAGLREAVGDREGFEEIRIGSFIVKSNVERQV